MIFLKFVHLSSIWIIIIISCCSFVINIQATAVDTTHTSTTEDVVVVVTSSQSKRSISNHDNQKEEEDKEEKHHQHQQQQQHHYLRMTSTRKNIEIYENEDEDTTNNINYNTNSTMNDSDNNTSGTTGDDYTYIWDRNHRFGTTATVSATGTATTTTTTPNNNVNRPTKAAVLIVQDASPGLDEEVLFVTSKVNRAYAMRWGYDYLQFTGIAVGMNGMNGVNGDNSNGTTDSSELWRATFNKPFLLSKLIQAKVQSLPADHATSSTGTSTSDSLTSTSTTSSTTISRLEQEQQPQQQVNSTNDAMNDINCNSTISCKTNKTPNIHNYDYVLFLDSSAIIVQLDYNILNLIQTENHMIATSTPDLADVMLWNLNHPQANYYSNEWMDKCYHHLNTNNENSGSTNISSMVQSEDILAKILNDNVENQSSATITADIVNPIPKEKINGLQGTLVKQDMTYNYYVVDDSMLRKKMPILNGISDSVCYRFYPQCEVV